MKNFYPTLSSYIQSAIADFDTIDNERKELLEQLSGYIREKKNKKELCNLTFICTHNSRRSHFSQIWAHVASIYYNEPQVATYSGGTEATALNINAVNALREAGMIIETNGPNHNPIYRMSVAEGVPEYLAWSKVYDKDGNPTESFAAIMTCDHADENCPFIPGADVRLPIRFEDPKAFDGTDEQDAKYAERSKQIATQLLYCFSKV